MYFFLLTFLVFIACESTTQDPKQPQETPKQPQETIKGTCKKLLETNDEKIADGCIKEIVSGLNIKNYNL